MEKSFRKIQYPGAVKGVKDWPDYLKRTSI